MPNLDGTETIKPTPFDVHEQVVRGPHTFDKEKGYVTTDPVHTLDENGEPVPVHEYPKAVDHVNKDGESVPLTEGMKDHLEPIVAKDANHEAELTGKPVAVEEAEKAETT